MKREEIRDILKDVTGVTDEHINAIIGLHGKGIESTKTNLNATITNLQEQIKTRDEDIAGLRKSTTDNADLQKRFDELQTKYNTETAALKADIDSRNYKDALNNAISENKIKFSSKAAENFFVSEAVKKNMKLEDGKLTGFSDFYKAQLDADKNAFVTENEAPKDGGNGDKPMPFFSGGTGKSETPPLSAAALAAAQFNSLHNRSNPNDKK